MTQHFRGSIPSNALGIYCRHILPLEGDVIYKCVCLKYQKCECFFVFTPNYFSNHPEPLAHSLNDPFMVLYTYITYLILCTVHGDQGWGTGRQRRLTRRVGMLLSGIDQMRSYFGSSDAFSAYVIIQEVQK